MSKSKFRGYITALVVSLIVIIHTTPAFAAITTVNIGPMRNTGNSNQQDATSAQQLIAQLRFDQIAGGAGTILKDNYVRIDRQGITSLKEQNLQVQKNGVAGNSTIATALVAERYFNRVTNPMTQAEVQRATRSALMQSLDSLIRRDPRIFGLQGDPSN